MGDEVLFVTHLAPHPAKKHLGGEGERDVEIGIPIVERVVAALDTRGVDIARPHLGTAVGKDGRHGAGGAVGEGLCTDVCGADIVEIVCPCFAPAILHGEMDVLAQPPPITHAEGHADLKELVFGAVGIGLGALAFGAQGLEGIPFGEACGGVGVLRHGVEAESTETAEDVGRGTLKGGRADAVGEEIELGTDIGLRYGRAEAEVAELDVVGVATLHVAVRGTHGDSPPRVEVEAGLKPQGGADGAEHALVVEVAEVVHAAKGETQFAPLKNLLRPKGLRKGKEKN